MASIDDLYRLYGPRYRAFVTGTGMLAAFTMVVASTIVNVAVPDVMGAFGVGQSQVQLMATAFMVAMTAGQLLNAWTVAVFGQRNGFIGTLVLFAAGSVVSGAAQSFDLVVLGRVMQGTAAGIIQPLIMVTIFQAFPEGRRGSALGLYTLGLVLAASVGPPLGGLAIEMFSWRAIFYAPLVFVGLSVPLGLLFMPSERGRHRPAFDWIGYTFLVVALFCLLMGISNGPRDGWRSDIILGMLFGGGLAVVAFLLSQTREGSSLLDLGLFRHRMFVYAVLVTSASAVGNFATVYGIPVAAQLVQGLTPLDAGLIIMPSMMVAVFMMPIAGRLSDRIPPHYALYFGMTVLALGTLPFAFADANTSFTMLVIYGLVGRWATAFVQPFIMNTALKTLPPEELNAGGGTINFCRQLGGSLGTVIWVVFVDWRIEFHSDAMAAAQPPGRSTTAVLLDRLAEVFQEAGVAEIHHTPGAVHFLGKMIEAQATALAFQDGFWVLFFCYLAGLIPVFFLGMEYRRLQRLRKK